MDEFGGHTHEPKIRQMKNIMCTHTAHVISAKRLIYCNSNCHNHVLLQKYPLQHASQEPGNAPEFFLRTKAVKIILQKHLSLQLTKIQRL